MKNGTVGLESSGKGRGWVWVGGLLLVLLATFIVVFWFHHKPFNGALAGKKLAEETSPDSSQATETSAAPIATPGKTSVKVPPSAEKVVARKLAQFARSRRQLAYALAQRQHVSVAEDVERFFAAVEAGNWDEIDAAFKVINGGDSSAGHADTRSEDVAKVWPAIIDAYGVAEQVHLWPAQSLLDYGNAVLGALKPGMVYVGGTDNGRWIPELLNETSDGEQHVVLTQNGLADASYLDFLRLQYDDRLSTLSEDDSQRAFQDYIDDARKRYEHDQKFPDEPKQIRPGEDIHIEDGHVSVGGQVAVMSINERLLQMLMQKNPDMSFAMEESFPLRGTYADAMPLGPLMELRAGAGTDTGENGFTSAVAAQTVDYWRNAAQTVLSNPEASGSDSVLKSYSHDSVAAANLLAARGFSSEAQQAYQLGLQLWPQNPEPIGGLADLLAAAGKENEARSLIEEFDRKYPAERESLERTSAAARLLWSLKPAK